MKLHCVFGLDRLLLVLAACLSLTQALPAAPTKKLPEPTAEAQAKAEAEIKNLFKSEFAGATVPARKLELSKALVKQASEIKGEPVAHFVLLRYAASLAAGAGELPTAIQSIDELAKLYEVDAVKLKCETVQASIKGATLPAQRAAIAEVAIALQDQAALADDYESSKQMGELALRMARDPLQKKQIALHNHEIDRYAKAYVAIKADLDTVHRNANDPAAYLSVGKYYLLVKSDWKTALPFLSKSADPVWSFAASTEIANPSTQADQIKLADTWWSLAEKQDGDSKRQLKVKACEWYRKQLANATGLTKSRIEKCIVEVDGLVIFQSNTKVSEETKTAFANYENLRFDVGIGNSPAGFGIAVAGLEFSKCERLQVTMDVFPTFTHVDYNAYVGFVIDYHSASGYTKRVALPVGGFDRTHSDICPLWGRSAPPTEFFDLGKKPVYDIDLRTWAPKDWDGQAWFNVQVMNSGTNSHLTCHIVPQK